jgi:hypothetical protein
MPQIPTIDPLELVDITVNGNFYFRIQQLAMYLVQGKEPKEINEIFENIANKKVEDILTAHIETVVVLMNEIERSAVANGKIKMEEAEGLQAES